VKKKETETQNYSNRDKTNAHSSSSTALKRNNLISETIACNYLWYSYSKYCSANTQTRPQTAVDSFESKIT